MGRCKNSYKFQQKVNLLNFMGGGVPSAANFFKNPQFMLCLDTEKLLNKAQAKSEFEV